MAKRIIFLGGKEIGYTCLSHIIEHREQLEVELIGVLTNNKSVLNKDLSVSKLAKDNGIKVVDDLDELLELDVDILYSVQYHQVLNRSHISIAKDVSINLHMAPLPEYRGCNQFSFAIIDQAKEFGTTIHVMEERIDAGAILFENRFPIPKDCYVHQLYNLCYEASVKLFKDTFNDIVTGNYNPIDQASFKGERNASFHLRNELEGLKNIDLNWDKEKIERHVRATWFPPFPPPYAYVDGKRIDITPKWITENLA